MKNDETIRIWKNLKRHLTLKCEKKTSRWQKYCVCNYMISEISLLLNNLSHNRLEFAVSMSRDCASSKPDVKSYLFLMLRVRMIGKNGVTRAWF